MVLNNVVATLLDRDLHSFFNIQNQKKIETCDTILDQILSYAIVKQKTVAELMWTNVAKSRLNKTARVVSEPNGIQANHEIC